MGNKGRPTKYNPKLNEQVEKLCLLGATDKDLANFFDVCEATINNWKNNPNFLESVKKGKVVADANVASSLYKRAVGYEYKETKIATHEGMITDEKEIDKHQAPDPTAAIFWLKNRKPEKWRDKLHLGGEFNLFTEKLKGKEKVLDERSQGRNVGKDETKPS